MTHVELQAALSLALSQIRGNTTLQTQLLNRAIRSIENLYSWPYMLTDVTSLTTTADQLAVTVGGSRAGLSVNINDFNLIYLPLKTFNTLQVGATSVATPLFWTWQKYATSDSIILRWWPAATISQDYGYQHYAYSTALSGASDHNWLTDYADGLVIAKTILLAQPFANVNQEKLAAARKQYNDELQALASIAGVNLGEESASQESTD